MRTFSKREGKKANPILVRSLIIHADMERVWGQPASSVTKTWKWRTDGFPHAVPLEQRAHDCV